MYCVCIVSIVARIVPKVKCKLLLTLTLVLVITAFIVMMYVVQGGRSRAVRATEANAQSSRSHAVLQLSVEVAIW